MIDDVMNNKYDVIVCYKFDRMVRNIFDFLNIFEELKKINVDLICV